VQADGAERGLCLVCRDRIKPAREAWVPQNCFRLVTEK
jgi:hypothetical protein